VLVALVERLVRALHENLAPLEKAGGSKPGQGAEDDLVKKRRLHPSFKQHVKCQCEERDARISAREDARPPHYKLRQRVNGRRESSRAKELPKSPLPGLHDPETKQCIREGVRQNTGSEAAGAVSDQVIQDPRAQCRRPVRPGMTQSKEECDHGKGTQIEFAEGNALNIFVDQKSKKKCAPENFFDKWNDDRESDKTQRDRQPVGRRTTRQKSRIKPERPRSEPEKLLRENPDQKNNGGNEESETNTTEAIEIVRTPETNQQRTARNRLKRIKPELRMLERERVTETRKPLSDCQKGEEDRHRQNVGKKRTALRLHCRGKTARYSCGVTPEDKGESPDALMRSVEQQLTQERLRWEREREKHRVIRLLSFSFLSLVILGALVALFLALSRANEMRGNRDLSRSPTPTPQSFP
jgi:hypothetical protein